MKKPSARTWRAALLVAVGLQLGCDGPTGPKGAALRITTQPSATAQTLVPLAIQPVIQVVDAADNPVGASGILVTAVVEDGDGAVLEGANATTDGNGVATFANLTLGADAADGGAIVLRFSATGLTPATANIQLSCPVGTITLGTTVVSQLALGDCRRTEGSTIGSRYKLFDLDITSATRAIIVADSSTAFTPIALVRGPGAGARFLGAGALNENPGVAFKVLVPTGMHRILATGTPEGAFGAFRLRVTETTENEPTVCSMQFASPLSTSQTLASGCVILEGLGIAQAFFFVLSNGSSINTSVTSSAFTPHISIWLSQGTTAIRQVFQDGTGSSASVSFTNSTATSNIYFVFVGTPDGAGTGDYSLTATITNPAP